MDKVEYEETSLCFGCGVAYKSYTFSDMGSLCRGCEYQRMSFTGIQLRLKLDCHRFYRHSALYAVSFGHGTKFGKSRALKNRLMAYEDAWCYPIISVQAIAMPPSLLEKAEKAGLNRLDKRHKSRGEFFYACSRESIIDAFEYICSMFAHELTDFCQTWRDDAGLGE